MNMFIKKYTRWCVAYKRNTEKCYHLISNPKFGWVADPFLIEYKNSILLFAEIFLYKTERKGVIGVCRYKGNGWGKWEISMDMHWHLSYPFVFVENGRLYMCPEAHQSNELSLYELQELPDKWIKKDTLLMNGAYVDSTFLNYEGQKYLFTFKQNTSWKDGGLYRYRFMDGHYVDETLITSDLSTARPGGAFFTDNDVLYRVSQDGSNGYGDSLAISRVMSVWPCYKELIEKRVLIEDVEIEGHRKYSGIHTYNRCGDLEVIDLKWEQSSLKEYLAQRRVRKVFMDKFR